jgi:hypothetical protein
VESWESQFSSSTTCPTCCKLSWSLHSSRLLRSRRA